MSTGAPLEIPDLAPPVNGHTHGHSRTRGHNRSRQWAQPPPPLSLEGSNGSPTKKEHTDMTSSGYSYGHASQPSYSFHNHSASPATPRHKHTHSAASASIHDGVHDHGLNEELVTRADGNHGQVHEVLSSALIALPWIVLSWYTRQWAQTSHLEQSDVAVKDGTPMAKIAHSGQRTCVLTAATLLLFGYGQIMRMNHQRGDSINFLTVKFPPLNANAVQVAALQTLAVGLPIYAALKIGGFLVAFALLLATASGVPKMVDAGSTSASKEKFSRKPFTIALLSTATLLSFLGMNRAWDSSPLMGYAALVLSVFVLPPPFPSLRRQGPIPEPGLVAEVSSEKSKVSHVGHSPIVVTADAPLALVSGGSLSLLTFIVSGGLPFSVADLLHLLIPAVLFAISLMISFGCGLRSSHKVGLAASTGIAALLCSPHFQDDYLVVYAARGILAAVSFFASRMDDSHLRTDAQAHNQSHHHRHSHSHGAPKASAATKWLIHRSEAYPLLNSILKEKDSRSIFYFMCLNFLFMLIQLSYGFLTGSLGLLSDSIHMFFDCLALVVGLCAAVMSKWPPSARFPYGYGKVDTLSGFANGIFLMIISVEIIYEAVERLSSGSQMHRISELLAVSVAGLLVNLVGIFSFEHGHHHGHGHDHGHEHAHGNENMHGIFLHILADTLGSVAVVISTVLVHYSGWSGYDPLASCFIAILIFASAVPLVSSTAKSLLLTLPADTEYNVRETLAGVSTLRGVVGYTVPKFWLDDTSAGSSAHAHEHDHSAHGCDDHHGHTHHHDHGHTHHHDHGHDHDHAHEQKSQKVFGVIHVIASRGSDLEDVRQRTVNYLQEKDMDIVVQVERDGDGRCWCGGGNKGS